LLFEEISFYLQYLILAIKFNLFIPIFPIINQVEGGLNININEEIDAIESAIWEMLNKLRKIKKKSEKVIDSSDKNNIIKLEPKKKKTK